MGFLKRLLSVRTKTKRKDDKNDKPKKSVSSSAGTQLDPIPQDQDAVVNRLLRSSSTHFSILSETEYRSLPPIPHPINNVLREPSIISSLTQTDSYKVTVHRRMLHSRTEFPYANRGSGTTTSDSPTRRYSLPPLTPGDKTRLSVLRQDPSVLSLLNVLDDAGHPIPESFSNTPARQERNEASLRVLLGNPSPPSLTTSKTSVEESDISWAERYIRTARRNSASSSSTTSSLGIPVDLFKSSISPERLRFDHSDSLSSRDMDVGIDSLQVERGTAEDASMIISPVIGLTSPARRASQFFKFLSDGADPQCLDQPPDIPPIPTQTPATCESVTPTQHHCSSSTVINLGVRDDGTSRGSVDIPILFVRDGPKEGRAEVSPAPRRHPPPSPHPTPPKQDQSPCTKALRPKAVQLGQRPPFDELRNAQRSDFAAVTQRSVSSRSVSLASSVHPEIETYNMSEDVDPYTPVASCHFAAGKRRNHGGAVQNVPPNAPVRPTRSQARRTTRVSRDCVRSTSGKKNKAPPVPLPAKGPVEQNNRTSIRPSITDQKLCKPSSMTTPPITPVKNAALSHLQTPSRPSPASSSELSPEGRRIMANVRAKSRKSSYSETPRPRAWQPWTGNPANDP